MKWLPKNEWLKMAKQQSLQKCIKCKKWGTPKYVENGATREKACPNCNWSRSLRVMTAEFKNKHGRMYRKDEAGLFKEVAFANHKEGIRLDYLRPASYLDE
jgi:hypothetical protein